MLTCFKALHPYYYRLINPEAALPLIAESEMEIDQEEATESKYEFPAFAPLVLYLFSPDRQVPTSSGTRFGISRLPAKSFASAISFCKAIGIWEGMPASSRDSIKIDEDWARSIDAAILDDSIRLAIEGYFAENSQRHALSLLLNEAWTAMVAGNEGLDGVRNIWKELSSLVPQDMLTTFVPRIEELRRLLKASKTEARRIAAESLGLLASHPDVPDETRRQLLVALVDGVEEKDIGSVAAAGFVFSRLKMRSGLSDHYTELANRAVNIMADILDDSRDSLLLDITVDALSELLAFSVCNADVIDIKKLRGILTERAKRGDEKSVLAIGYTTFVSTEDPKPIIEDILKIGESANVEMSFVVGEAVTAAAAKWGSNSLRRRRRIAGVEWQGPRRNGVGEVMAACLQRAMEPGGGSRRRTTIVALLSLLELCPEDQELKDKLEQVQQTFRSFLTDRDGM